MDLSARIYQAHSSGFPMIADGGLGTMLRKRLKKAAPELLEELNLRDPDTVRDLHREYLAAGARLITTNSMCASKLTPGAPTPVRELNTAAVRLAREAIDSIDGKGPVDRCFVIGSIGPGTSSATPSPAEYNVIKDAVTEQTEALASAGVDAILLETILGVEQAKAALEGVRAAAPELFCIVSFSPGPDSTLVDGTPVRGLANQLSEWDFGMLGLNCGHHPEAIARQAQLLRETWAGPIWIAPSLGIPDTNASPGAYPCDGRTFVSIMVTLIDTVKPAVIGGCCGTTPDLIKQLASLVPRQEHQV